MPYRISWTRRDFAFFNRDERWVKTPTLSGRAGGGQTRRAAGEAVRRTRQSSSAGIDSTRRSPGQPGLQSRNRLRPRRREAVSVGVALLRTGRSRRSAGKPGICERTRQPRGPSPGMATLLATVPSRWGIVPIQRHVENHRTELYCSLACEDGSSESIAAFSNRNRVPVEQSTTRSPKRDWK